MAKRNINLALCGNEDCEVNKKNPPHLQCKRFFAGNSTSFKPKQIGYTKQYHCEHYI